jgi:DNA-binding NtrC family response regulator
MAHILVIDDEEHLRTIYEQYLIHDGHTVSTAENGLTAIKLLNHLHFDLVITDIVMPEQDGLGVLNELHKYADAPPVIVISGGSLRLDPHQLLTLAKNLKAQKTLAKPVSYEQLHAAVDAVLAQSKLPA